MKTVLRLASVILSLSLVFTACSDAAESTSDNIQGTGSSVEQSAEYESSVKEFCLAFSTMDTLDPYSAKSKQNKELSTLLYDSLFTVDSSYRLIYRVGSSVETYEKFMVVTLRDDVFFTDGTLLTSADVVASFNAAKKSNTAGYKDDLANFKSCTVLSDNVVTFELKNALPSAQYALTFPIFKDGTRGNKMATGIIKAPVGSGRYIYSNVNGNATLVANNSWAFGSIKTQTLYLTDTVDEQAVNFCLSNGKINCGYDDLSDEAIDTSNGSTVYPVPLNNIVFLGANSSSKYFGDNEFRKYLSYLLDREKICSDCFISRALAATGVYNPQYEEMKNNMELLTVPSPSLAQQAFSNLKFDENKDSEGFYTVNGVRPTLRLVVNKSSSFRVQTANYIATLLSTNGIHCQLSVFDSDEYMKALQNGKYDFYVGEMKIGTDLSISSLLNVYGTSDNDAVKAYKKYRSGAITITEFMDVFEEELPVIPLCFRLGAVFLPKNMQGEMNPSYSDAYFNIQNCYF